MTRKRMRINNKRQTAKDLAQYFLDGNTERQALLKTLKGMNFTFNGQFDRRAIRKVIEPTLWYRASSILYGRPVARVMATILIDEVVA